MPSLTNPDLITLACTVHSDDALEIRVVDGAREHSLTHPSTELLVDIDERHSGTAVKVPDLVQDNVRYVASASTLEGGASDDWTRDEVAVKTGRIFGHPDDPPPHRTVEVTMTPTAYVEPAGQPPLDTTPKTTTIRIRIHEKGIRPIR